MRVAVVGAGSIGREFSLHHFNEQLTGTSVVSIIDKNLEAAKALALDVGAAKAGGSVVTGQTRYHSTVEAKEDAAAADVVHGTDLTSDILDGCDMVYIGTTPSSHKELVLAALDAGKHVLLEKPLASTAAGPSTKASSSQP